MPRVNRWSCPVTGSADRWSSIPSTSHPVPPATYPQYKAGMPNCCAILLRMRLAYAITVTSDAVGSYPAFSPLPIQAVIFCSAFCQKGRYAVEKKISRTMATFFFARLLSGILSGGARTLPHTTPSVIREAVRDHVSS